MTKIYCRDKTFVAASILLSWQKTCFVTKQYVRVMTNTCLLRQKFYLWQLPPMIEQVQGYCFFVWCPVNHDGYIKAKRGLTQPQCSTCKQKASKGTSWCRLLQQRKNTTTNWNKSWQASIRRSSKTHKRLKRTLIVIRQCKTWTNFTVICQLLEKGVFTLKICACFVASD